MLLFSSDLHATGVRELSHRLRIAVGHGHSVHIIYSLLVSESIITLGFLGALGHELSLSVCLHLLLGRHSLFRSHPSEGIFLLLLSLFVELPSSFSGLVTIYSFL